MIARASKILEKYPNLSYWVRDMESYLESHSNFFILLNKKGKNIDLLFEKLSKWSDEAYLYFSQIEKADSTFLDKGWVKKGRRLVPNDDTWVIDNQIYYGRGVTPVVGIPLEKFVLAEFLPFIKHSISVSNPSAGSVSAAWSFCKKRAKERDKIWILKKNYSDPTLALVGNAEAIIPVFENIFLETVHPEEIQHFEDDRRYITVQVKFRYAKKVLRANFESAFSAFEIEVKDYLVETDIGYSTEATLYGTYCVDYEVKQKKIKEFVFFLSDMLKKHGFPEETIIKTKYATPNTEFSWQNLSEQEFSCYI